MKSAGPAWSNQIVSSRPFYEVNKMFRLSEQ